MLWLRLSPHCILHRRLCCLMSFCIPHKHPMQAFRAVPSPSPTPASKVAVSLMMLTARHLASTLEAYGVLELLGLPPVVLAYVCLGLDMHQLLDLERRLHAHSVPSSGVHTPLCSCTSSEPNPGTNQEVM